MKSSSTLSLLHFILLYISQAFSCILSFPPAFPIKLASASENSFPKSKNSVWHRELFSESWAGQGRHAGYIWWEWHEKEGDLGRRRPTILFEEGAAVNTHKVNTISFRTISTHQHPPLLLSSSTLWFLFSSALFLSPPCSKLVTAHWDHN